MPTLKNHLYFLNFCIYSCSHASYNYKSSWIMAVGQEMPKLWGSWLGHSRILRFWFHSQKGSGARIYENGYKNNDICRPVCFHGSRVPWWKGYNVFKWISFTACNPVIRACQIKLVLDPRHSWSLWEECWNRFIVLEGRWSAFFFVEMRILHHRRYL